MKKGWVVFIERGLFAPFLLAVQPVLQVYLLNLDELAFSETVRTLGASLLLVAVAFGGIHIFLKDRLRTSLVASLGVLIFFAFGDLTNWLAKTFALGPARSDLFVFCGVVVLIVIWFWLVRHRIKDPVQVNLYFNVLSILFLAYTGFQVLQKLSAGSISLKPSNQVISVANVAGNTARPDIYYIVLDGYGRQDILQSLYDLDNTEFITALEARGFYVAHSASSNYIQTLLSLGSSLNMEYIQNMQVADQPLENRADLIEILNYSEVRKVLAQHGYQTVSFANTYKATLSTADIYFATQEAGLTHPVTAFETIVLDHSMARILKHIPAFNQALNEMPYETHRAYVLTTFAQLQEIPQMNGDYFVYAHIITPHPPFVFDETGAVVSHTDPFTLFDANYYIRDHSRREYIAGYRAQLQYVNTLVLTTLDAILKTSETPPIIILQGDHGPGAYLHWGSLEQTVPAERFGILNAYYFPDQDYTGLYPEISPVNSFRVILNQFFQAEYARQPDLHYYSSWSFPFDFINVTDLSLP